MLKKALSLDPNFALAWAWSGSLNSYVDRYDIATEQAMHALRLSPRDLYRHIIVSVLAQASFSRGQYLEAAAHAEDVLRARHADIAMLYLASAGYALGGRAEDARRIAKRLLELHPDFSTRTFLEHTWHRSELFRQRMIEGLLLAGIPD